MSLNAYAQSVTATSPASASTTILGTFRGLSRWDSFTVVAELQGATGGTLNVYLQRKIADDVWSDWVSFTQLASGAAAVKYAVCPTASNTISTVGSGSDATPSPALAAGSCAGGHPGDAVRVVAVAGAGTSGGTSQTVRIHAQRGVK